MNVPTREVMYRALEMRHGREFQQKIQATTVAVCGLGGLGSNIAIALARAGVGRLILIDFDKVDITNLHRQQYAVRHLGMHKAEAIKDIIKEIAPYTETIKHTIKITDSNIEELLRAADIVCEAFDNAEEKAMLVNGVLEKYPQKYLVAASGMAGLESANNIRTRKVMSKFYLCGDEKSDVDADMGLISSRVMLCAAHQAHMVLRIIAEEFDT